MLLIVVTIVHLTDAFHASETHVALLRFIVVKRYFFRNAYSQIYPDKRHEDSDSSILIYPSYLKPELDY